MNYTAFLGVGEGWKAAVPRVRVLEVGLPVCT